MFVEVSRRFVMRLKCNAKAMGFEAGPHSAGGTDFRKSSGCDGQYRFAVASGKSSNIATWNYLETYPTLPRIGTEPPQPLDSNRVRMQATKNCQLGSNWQYLARFSKLNPLAEAVMRV